MSPAMVEVGRVVCSYLNKTDLDARVEEFNSMVLLLYYDKTGRGRTLQLPLHRDQRYNAKGEFMSSMNSQKENTSTCVLTLGDPRILFMQCFKDSGDGRGSLEVEGPGTSVPFTQIHGCLFKLHPLDEQSKLRSELDAADLTFFKHGRIHFCEGLSVGLAFRTCVNTRLVDCATGKLVLEKPLSARSEPDAKRRQRKRRKRNKDHDAALRLYMEDVDRRNQNEAKLRKLHLHLKEKYFGAWTGWTSLMSVSK